MADYREMLGLEHDPAEADVARKRKKSSRPKPAAPTDDLKRGRVVGKLGKRNPLSRELHALQSQILGAEADEEVAPVMPQLGFQKRAKLSSRKPAVRWQHTQYPNKEGPGAVTLTHCRPVTYAERNRNTFLRFNKAAEVYTYTDAQYQAKLHDADWSREETDALMRLAVQFDGRLVVMHDRWVDLPGGKARSLEDIKARFYAVQEALHPTGYVFDLAAANTRKRHFEILYNRTGHEVWEEFEAKKMYEPIARELQKAKVASARAKNLVAALEHGVKDYAMQEFRRATAVPGADGADADDDDMDSNELDDGAQRNLEAWSPEKLSSTQKSAKKKKSKAAADVPNANLAAMQTAVDAELKELKIPNRPSSHPQTQQMHAELRNSIMVLLDLRKLIAQKLYEIHLLKGERVAILQPDANGINE